MVLPGPLHTKWTERLNNNNNKNLVCVNLNICSRHKKQMAFSGQKVLAGFPCLQQFFPLLVAFANSLDLDQDRLNICPDLDPSYLTL